MSEDTSDFDLNEHMTDAIDENDQDSFSVDQTEDDQHNNEQSTGTDEKVQLDPNVEKAIELGWKDKTDWQGDPDDWNSARQFLKTKDIVESNKSLRSKIDSMESSFNSRIENLQMFHQKTLENKISELKNKRDTAASEADMDVYNEANKELESLQKEPETPKKNQIDPALVMEGIIDLPVTQKFINDNQWIKGNGAKAVYGQKILTDWVTDNINNPNAIVEDGLKMITQAIAKEFPSANQQGSGTAMADRGKNMQGKRNTNSLTMDKLTHQEMEIYRTMGNSFKNKEEFLQTVADSRKGV